MDGFEVYENYGADRLVALPRDSDSFYVYWEVSDRRKKMAEEHFRYSWSGLPKYLRIYDVSYLRFNGDHANRYWDVGIHHEASNWFVKDAAPDCTYIVDYGTTTVDGRFITILRSNTIKLPPKEAYSGIGSQWAKLNVDPPAVKREWEDAFTGYSLNHQKK